MKLGLPVVLFALFTLAVLAPTAACTTTKAPGVCCIGPEDCARLGLTEDRPCPQGQACADFHCTVAACSTQGCAAEAPVCDVATDVCTGCADSSDCSRFADTDVCRIETGACVECLTPADCTATAEPVCDNGTCRGCRLDAECPSSACADDGTCAAEAAIVYLDPGGQDIAPCSRSAPCIGLQFGIRQTSSSRNHLVMTLGTYVADAITIRIDPANTLASRIHIHGGGATLTHGGLETLLDIRLPTLIRDLEIEYGSSAIFTLAETTLERVRIQAGSGIQATWLKARDVSFQTTGPAISISGTLDLDRAIVAGGTNGIAADSSSSVQISNLLVYGTSDVALDLQGATGSVDFSTIADTGINSMTASGIACLQFEGPTIRSSIIWTPGSLRPPINGGGCNLVSVIAGPIGVAGAQNVNPLFVNPQMKDYHLSANSPARDMVDTGPALDFERDSRPRGARFDIGADESP